MPTLPSRFVGTAIETAYLLRVEANLSGECPWCRSTDAELKPIAPRQAVGSLAHELGCPVSDDGPLAAALFGIPKAAAS